MPWNLSANIGVKHRKSIRGLFISPGLFIDPGFGRKDDAAEQSGERLRFLATNMGKDPIELRLGSEGDHVVGVQFFKIKKPDKKLDGGTVVVESAQGMALFEDLGELGTQLDRSIRDMQTKVDGVEKAVHRTESATDRIVVFGIFLIAFTLLGAIFTAILAMVASDNGVSTAVNALNELDSSRPWTLAILISIVALAVACTVWMALLSCRAFRATWRSHERS
jgi:hypothetical protein